MVLSESNQVVSDLKTNFIFFNHFKLDIKLNFCSFINFLCQKPVVYKDISITGPPLTYQPKFLYNLAQTEHNYLEKNKLKNGPNQTIVSNFLTKTDN